MIRTSTGFLPPSRGRSALHHAVHHVGCTICPEPYVVQDRVQGKALNLTWFRGGGWGAMRYAFLEVRMTRADIVRGLVSVRKGSFGKPDLFQVKVGDRALMVKDVRGKSFFSRWTVGLWLIHKEWKIYSRLGEVKNIPRPVERIDRFAFAMEFIPARPINRGEKVSPPFFSGLEEVLRKIHSRGVVHLDLRHKGNILVSEKGEPILIDFNSSFLFREKGFLRHVLFPVLKWVDHGGLLKLKQRVSPSSMTPEELSFLKRFNRLRRLWIFN